MGLKPSTTKVSILQDKAGFPEQENIATRYAILLRQSQRGTRGVTVPEEEGRLSWWLGFRRIVKMLCGSGKEEPEMKARGGDSIHTDEGGCYPGCCTAYSIIKAITLIMEALEPLKRR